MAAQTVSTRTRVHRRTRAPGSARLHRLSPLRPFGRLLARACVRTWAVFAEATALLVDVGPHGAGATGTGRRSGANRTGATRSDAGR